MDSQTKAAPKLLRYCVAPVPMARGWHVRSVIATDGVESYGQYKEYFSTKREATEHKVMLNDDLKAAAIAQAEPAGSESLIEQERRTR